MNNAKQTEGPVLIHVITKKEKGYTPAETDRIATWHGTGPYKMETGEFPKSKTTAPGWSKFVADTVTRVARDDQRVVTITPAMPVGSKLMGFAEEFPERFFDVGIAEQHATTMAAGMAVDGCKPFLSIYSTFLQRAYDQVLHDICRQNLNVFIGIDRAGLVGADGETHQGVFDIPFLRSMPNITIMMPKDENEGQHMVKTALAHEQGPIAMRYPRGNGRGVPMDSTLHTIPIGTWESLRDGIDASILTFGTTIPMAEEAAAILAEQGTETEVINARFIKPMDEAMLHRLFKANKPILTIEESMLEGGFGSAVLEFANAHGYNTAQVKRMGIPDEFIEHGSVDLLLRDIHMTKEQVVEDITTLVEKTKQQAGLKA